MYSAIHYHTIWRDRARDYGGNFYTTALATKAATAGEVFSVYPNPAATGGAWHVQLAEPTATATYSVRNSLGQQVKAGSIARGSGDISASDLVPGLCSITVDTPTPLPATTKGQLN